MRSINGNSTSISAASRSSGMVRVKLVESVRGEEQRRRTPAKEIPASDVQFQLLMLLVCRVNQISDPATATASAGDPAKRSR